MARRDRDDEAPPWAAVEAEPRHTWISWRSLIIGALVAMAVAAALVLGVKSLVGRDDGDVAGGGPPLIRAPAEPYKTLPADAGGTEIEGVDQTIYAAGEGEDPQGTIALDGGGEEVREEPGEDAVPVDLMGQTAAEDGDAALVDGTAVEPPVAAAAAPETAPAARAPVEAGLPATLQLGAFSTRAKADAAWKTFTQRFAYLADLTKSVEATAAGDATLYRLRATGVESRARARELCARMRVAGESCLVAG